MGKIVWFAFFIIILCQCTRNDQLISNKRVSNLRIGNLESNILSKLDMYNVNELKDIGISGLEKFYN